MHEKENVSKKIFLLLVATSNSIPIDCNTMN